MTKRNPQSKRRQTQHKIKRLYLSNVFWLLLCIILSVVILSVDLVEDQVFVAENEIAGEDVYYRGNTTTYTSEIRTEEARTEAAAAVNPVYVIDETVLTLLQDEIQSYFDAIGKVAGAYDYYGSDALTALREELPGSYADSTLQSMLYLNEAERTFLCESFLTMVEQAYGDGVSETEIESARNRILESINNSTITGEKEVFLKNLLAGLDLPYNEAYDAIATAAAVEEAQAAVQSVQITVQSGEKIISRGSVVTALQVEALQMLGLFSDNPVYTPYIGLLVLVALVLTLLYLYLRIYQRELFRRRSAMLVLSTVILLVLLLCKLISLLTMDGDSSMNLLAGYLLPVATASMLVTVLLNRDTAIVTTVVLAVFVAVMMDGQISCVLVALGSGIAGVLSASRLSQRSQFVNASIYLILVNVAVIGAWGLLWGDGNRLILLGMLFGVVNGLLSAVLAMGILPFLESGFGITTVIRLLELSNSNDPLLKRLMMEAPGTYNHSVLVGNLAEAAADAIGANALLVRVASYYHDVGKLKRPHFFIENQRPGENPHDKLQPALSAMIITSHPTDGVKMLKERRFPVEILDLVEQHHGTGVLHFFYHKAKENALDPEDVRLEDFCYQGKKPQTKEAALLMLADSVQAGVQALHGGTKEQIEERVRSVIESKIQEGQLQESPLTFKDIDIINRTFLTVLAGMNHTRISYPGQEKAELGGLEVEALSADTQRE